VHVPFCHSECTYCDFYRESYRAELADRFLSALSVEMASLPECYRPRTVYVGGGTPSALRPNQLERLLGMLSPLAAGCLEYTFEVNPLSATSEKVALLRSSGVNRVSFGAQSFHDGALALLGRRHRSRDIVRAYHRLRAVFPRLNFDLIFGWPGQTPHDWRRDLSQVVSLEPDHLSVYSLVYEPHTPLTKAVEDGLRVRLDEETERAMFLHAIDVLAAEGYEHYEVSNYARPCCACLHNLAYWTQADYYGLGPGACSTVGSLRRRNLPDLRAYCDALLQRGVVPCEVETLSPKDRFNEHILLSLRTREGLHRDEVSSRWPEDLLLPLWGAARQLRDRGLLVEESGRLRLSREGLCVGDQVILKLMV
jgi:oxygen-independent coproporphyrinogen-3 oxidase